MLNLNDIVRNDLERIVAVEPEKDGTATLFRRTPEDKVERLFNQGMQIEDIAAELSCSTSEVQFIIDMF